VPSGDHATCETVAVWPVRVWRVVPVVGSQILAVPSALVVASWVPSGDHATYLTIPVWPCAVRRSSHLVRLGERNVRTILAV
jgi:hypothetical protein